MKCPMCNDRLELIKRLEARIAALEDRIEAEMTKVPPYYQLPIDRLGLPTRTLTALMLSGLRTLGDLIQTSDKDLLRLRHIGKVGLRAIRQAVDERKQKQTGIRSLCG